MSTILITGGTGLTGKHLTGMLLSRNDKVIILSRSIKGKTSTANVQYSEWNPSKDIIDDAVLQEADVIIHLAGAGVMEKRWREKYKKEIVSSRVNSIQCILNRLQKIKHKVHTLISASATGWYGESHSNNAFTEDCAPATDFLGETCRLWEAASDEAEKMNIRVVKLRTGIVLTNRGGAYPQFKLSLKFGIAGILGNGNQYISWIHMEDLCRMYIHAIDHTNIRGAYNAVAPYPVTQKKLVVDIAKLIRGGFYIPMHIPSFILKIMFGESAVEILKSMYASCDKIKKNGFTYLYPSIEAAIHQLETKDL